MTMMQRATKANKATNAKKVFERATTSLLALLAFLAFLATPSRGALQPPDPTTIRQQEIEQERDIKSQVRDILDRTLGPNHDSIISVTVAYQSGGETEITTTNKANEIDQKVWLLPGIPNPNVGKSVNAVLDQETKTRQTPLKFKRSISVTIDKKFAAKKDALKKIMIDSLNLLEPVDKLYLEDMEFASSGAGQIVSSFGQDKWMLLILMVGFGMLIFTVFLFGPIRGFLKGMSSAMVESRARQFSIEMGGGGGAALGGGGVTAVGGGGVMTAGGIAAGGSAGAISAGSGTTTLEGGGSGEAGGETVVVEQRGGGSNRPVKFVRPFSFIKKTNIPNLVYLVQEEPPEIVALIMSYLDPEEGAELMSALPTDLQTKVALSMATVKQASHESVVRAEDAIKKKLDFLVGGIERFISIIDRVDPATREEILSTLEKESPALVERLKREIFTFDNLIDLDDPALQLVLREVKTESLAKSLKDAPEVLVEKVKHNISAGAQTLLSEEMQLQGYLTPLQVGEERRKIVDLIRKLEKEGKIALKRTKVKAQRVERIQRLEEAMGLPALPGEERVERVAAGSGAGESVVGLPASERTPRVPAERKVSLSDLEGKATGRRLSMSNIFKQAGPEKMAVSGKGAKEERRSSQAAPAQPEPQALQAYQEGSAAYDQQAYEAAMAAFKQCVEMDPNFWQGYQGLGNCYTALGMVTEAIQAYEETLKLQPNNPGLRQWLDEYKAKQGA